MSVRVVLLGSSFLAFLASFGLRALMFLLMVCAFCRSFIWCAVVAGYVRL